MSKPLAGQTVAALTSPGESVVSALVRQGHEVSFENGDFSWGISFEQPDDDHDGQKKGQRRVRGLIGLDSDHDHHTE